MPEGLSDGVAIEGMQQFAAAVSSGTHVAAVMSLEGASHHNITPKVLSAVANQVWNRHKHIPSAKADPLSRIFSSFDTDQDGECTQPRSVPVFQSFCGPCLLRTKYTTRASGHLTAKEVAAALRSRNVDLTEAIVQKFIEGESNRAA